MYECACSHTPTCCIISLPLISLVISKITVECLMKIIIKLIPWNAIQNILIDVVVLFVFVATPTATLYTLTLLIPFIFF